MFFANYTLKMPEESRKFLVQWTSSETNILERHLSRKWQRRTSLDVHVMLHCQNYGEERQPLIQNLT